MMNMTQIEPNREWLLRYVLGELSEDETRSADERFFSDEIFAAMLDETYRDVLDTYSADEIAGSEKLRAGRAFFAGGHQERRLKILQAMQALPGKMARVAGRPAERVSKPWFRSFWPVAVSVGVLSLTIAAVAYQYSEKFHGAANGSISAGEPVSRNLPEISSAPSATPASVESKYTILLLPNVSRGEDEVKNFAIPSSANEIVFQALVPQGFTSTTFGARLKGARQRDAQVFSGLAAETLEAQKYVEFHVKAGDLPTDAYAVDVFDSAAPVRTVVHFMIRVSREMTPRN
jgi:hypothetical protein